MTVAKDGYVVFGRVDAGRRRRCLRCVWRRCALLALLAVLTLQVGVASDALGQGGSVSRALWSTAPVLANQAMTLFGEPQPPKAETERSAAANRPAALKTQPAAAAVEAAENDPVASAAGWSDSLDEVVSDDAELPGPTPEPTIRLLDSAALEGSILLASNMQPSGLEAELAGEEDTDLLVASISVASERAERITVARNATAVIDLKVPVDRIEIADPETADVQVPSPKRIIITGLTHGTTQLILWFGEEQRVFNVSVEVDLAMLRDLIKSIAPASNVELRSISGQLLIRGTVPDAETAEQIVQLASLVAGEGLQNQLRVAGVQQTMLRVVVAEVNREATRQLGFNWAIGGSDWSRNFFFANNLAGINPTFFTSSGVPDVVRGQLTYALAGVGNTGAGVNVTFGFPRAELQMFLNALRENGLSRVLAEPNLVAISGQTATFLAGGEVPIPVAQGGAVAGAITIEYREFGVRLAFTPTVAAGQIIRLHVMTEISEAVPTQQIAGGFPVFTFNTRRVESTIECGNGQTFAIAGLLSERTRAVASKIPGLGDIPVLGALFSSTNYQKSSTELVVLVTPQLVEPLDPQQVPPVPGSLMTEPNDFDFFALQKMEGPPLVIPEDDRVPRQHVPVNVRPTEVGSWSTSQLALRGPWGLAEFAESN